MTAEERLEILKIDLGKATSANDDLLKNLLIQAEEAMQKEGVKKEESTSYDMLIIQYAAYLFRKRAAPDSTMPRFLRYQLINMFFAQKGQANDV